MRSRIAVAVTTLLVLGAVPAVADIVNLSASKDNTLFFSAAGALSNAKGQFLFTGRTALGEIRRAVVHFDVAGTIPAGSTVNTASLKLTYDITRVTPPGNIATNGSRLHTAKRLLADWGEGTSDADGEEGAGANSTTGDATWAHRNFNTVNWTTAGGQFSGTTSASVTVGTTPGVYTFTSGQLAADVQSMLDTPGGNFGWIVQGVESSTSTAKRFGSREHPNVAARPVLTVDYTAPTAAPGMPAWGPMALATLLLATAMPLVIRRQSVMG
jgi:hypothetical protein